MSQSSTPQSSNRVVLFQHGGELSEFVEILEDLAIPLDKCEGGFPDLEQLDGARLVIVSGRRLLESGTPDLSLWPRTIAVIDDSSRTLVLHLNRVGVSMVIRRPIHPRALRLLLLHEIYRGPERRGRKRILIGHPIRVSSGLFKPSAILLELSSTGARIELANAPKVGSRLRLLFGKDLTNNKPLKLQARVIRSIRASDKKNRPEAEIGVAILDANRHAKTIKGILDRFALGPAKWKTKGRPQRIESNSNPITSTTQTIEHDVAPTLPPTRVATPERTPPTVELELVDAVEHAPAEQNSNTAQNSDELNDRRQDARVPYDQRVVALGEEAARVLVGRDLASGGMRIASTPAVSIGDVFRVALHSGAQTEPLVVVADALRDDGDDGIVLSFKELSPSQSEQLEKIISSSLPVHTNTDDIGDPSAIGEAIVVAEILETVKTQDDPEIDALLDSVFKTD